MRIRIIQTCKGSPDGIQVNEYEAGQVYDLPSSLAHVFLEQGWAEEDKAISKAPETKEVKADVTKADNTTTKRSRNTSSSKKSSKS